MSDRTERFYPKAPRVGVGVVVIRETDERQVLLVLRGKEPAKGKWSVPGGSVELGETISEAAAREVHEETGLDVEIGSVITAVDAIYRDGDEISFHYVIIDVLAFAGADAAPVPADDADDAQWVSVDEVASVEPLTENLPVVVQQAIALIDAGLVEVYGG